MSGLARLLARNLWAAMLWFMRRPWMKRLQRGSIQWFPEGPRRDHAWESFRKQERFARKYGLRILTAVIMVCLYSIALAVAYSFLTYAIDQGWIPLKDRNAAVRHLQGANLG